MKVQLEQSWANARWVLDDLTDDEYHWEPAPRSWSVRRRGDGVIGWGTGAFVCEDGWPPPEPVPIPTIAWRVVHLAAWTDIYRDWTFGAAAARLADFEVPGTAVDGLAWLRRAQDRFSSAVGALGDHELFELRPAHWGELLPVARLVTSMLTEHVHHIAEIGVLRDLFRGHARMQPLPRVSGPSWWLPQPPPSAV